MAKAKARKAAPPAVVGRTYATKARTGRFPTGSPAFGFAYTTPEPYCQVKRLKQGRCATQLNFINGETVLRLCGEYGQPGRVVPVSSPEDASKKAAKFCKIKVGRKGRTSGEKPESMPEVVPELVPDGGDGGGESVQSRSDDVLSGWPKRPERQRPQRGRSGGDGNTVLWLMGGTAMGLLAMKMMKGDDNV